MNPSRRRILTGLALGASIALGYVLDRSAGWTTPAFRAISQLFYEQSALATLGKPSQIALFLFHLLISSSLASIGLIVGTWLGPHGRRWISVFCLAYAIRAAIWTAGSNLPLVPGDSCHYVEIASSILN